MSASARPDWQDYAVEYRHDGLSWGLTVRAADEKEARRRLYAIGATGEVTGELQAVIHLSPRRLCPHSVGLGLFAGLAAALIVGALR